MNTEALTTLAITLNDARKQAEYLASQDAENHRYGIYNQIAEALEKVLTLLIGPDAAPRAYELLLRGHTVPVALAFTRLAYPTTTEAGTR